MGDVYAEDTKYGRRRIWQVPAQGGKAEPLTKGFGDQPHWSPGGERLYFVGEDRNLRALAMGAGTELPVTDLSGRDGRLGPGSFDVDEDYLYFAWAEDLGDIWVMDVVTE